MKYYFFRDIDNESNLNENKTFHAAGIVKQLNEPNGSGKDVLVCFFEPFEGIFTTTWRAIHEVELFEVDEWEYKRVVENYEI